MNPPSCRIDVHYPATHGAFHQSEPQIGTRHRAGWRRYLVHLEVVAKKLDSVNHRTDFEGAILNA